MDRESPRRKWLPPSGLVFLLGAAATIIVAWLLKSEDKPNIVFTAPRRSIVGAATRPEPAISGPTVAIGRAEFVDHDRDQNVRWMKCVDEDGSAIEDASIRGAAELGKSRADGIARIENAPPVLVVVASTFVPESVDPRTLSDSEKTPTVIKLTKGRRVVGRVVDDLDRPVADAVVRVSRGSAQRFRTMGGLDAPIIPPPAPGEAPSYAMTMTTKDDGLFQFEGVAAAEHALTASRFGYTSSEPFLVRSIDPSSVDPLRVVLHRVFVGAVVVDSACPHGGRHDLPRSYSPSYGAPKGFLRFIAANDGPLEAARSHVMKTLDRRDAVAFAFGAMPDTPDEGGFLTVSIRSIDRDQVRGARVTLKPLHLWRVDDATHLKLHARCSGHGKVTVEADAGVVLCVDNPPDTTTENYFGDDVVLLPVSTEGTTNVFEAPAGRYYVQVADRLFVKPSERRISDGFDVRANDAIVIKANPTRGGTGSLVVSCVDGADQPSDQFGLYVHTADGGRFSLFCRPGNSELRIKLVPGQHLFVLKDASGGEILRERIEVTSAGSEIRKRFVLGVKK